MDTKRNAGQVLIDALVKISNDLSRFIKIFEKFESKQDGEDKDSLEFRVEIVNQIELITEKLKDVILKLNLMDEKFINTLNEIKSSIFNQEKINYSKIKSIMEETLKNIKAQISDKCSECFILKEKEKWIKRLVIAIVIIAGFLFLLLGLNVFEYIKLPGMK